MMIMIIKVGLHHSILMETAGFMPWPAGPKGDGTLHKTRREGGAASS
jgi:hypothetical protein